MAISNNSTKKQQSRYAEMKNLEQALKEVYSNSGNQDVLNTGATDKVVTGNGAAGKAVTANGKGEGDGAAAQPGFNPYESITRQVREQAAPLHKPTVANEKGVESAGATVNEKGVDEGAGAAANGSMNGYAELTPEMREAAVQGIDTQIRTYKDMLGRLQRPESEWERKAREKKERSRRIVGAVSDGLRALSNLFFTTKYAPNMYNHQKDSQYDAAEARIEKLRAERDKNDAAYNAYNIKIGELEGGKVKTLRELEDAFEKRKEEAKKAERALQLHQLALQIKEAEKDRAKNLVTKSEADVRGAESDAIKKESDAEWAGKLNEGKYANLKSSAAAHNAAANNSNAGASLKKEQRKQLREKDGFNVSDASGKTRKVHNNNIDNEFSGLPANVRQRAGNDNAYGNNKPTKEQKMQAIAEYERTKGKPKGTRAKGFSIKGRR